MAEYGVYLSKSKGLKEISTVQCVADTAGSLGGKYFTINSVSTLYYVWYDVDDGSNDPDISDRTGIEVDIATGETANNVATKTKTAIDAIEGFDATVATDTVTVTNSDLGSVVDAADVDSGHTIGVSTQGYGPENGTEGTDYIKFVCAGIQLPITVSNPKKRMVAHKSFRVAVGLIVQTITLINCLFLQVDGGSDSNYYDNFVKLVLDHANSGSGKGFKLYLWVGNPFLDNKYVKWYDNSGTMQDYCQVFYAGSNFKMSAEQLKMTGNIVLEEVWD